MNTSSLASAATIIKASAADLEGIRWLLDIEELPSADITESMLEHFLVFRDETGVAGAVGLEVHGEVGLLRSLVVTTAYIGHGLGRRLVFAVEELAAELNIGSLYLLTTTAEAFFEHMGFRRIPREEAPPAIQCSREFASLCPATAVLLVKP